METNPLPGEPGVSVPKHSVLALFQGTEAGRARTQCPWTLSGKSQSQEADGKRRVEKYTNVITQPKDDMKNRRTCKWALAQGALRLPASGILAMDSLTQQRNLAAAGTFGRRGPTPHSITFPQELFLPATCLHSILHEMSWESGQCVVWVELYWAS